jgi:hypothetical protein
MITEDTRGQEGVCLAPPLADLGAAAHLGLRPPMLFGLEHADLLIEQLDSVLSFSGEK